MIHFHNYSCRYAAKDVLLRKLNLHIREGEFVFVTGPSGGGKSTLCFSINGLIPNELQGSEIEGKVVVDGIEVAQVYPYELISIVGTVLQDPEWQLVRGTVKEELTFALENMGVAADEIDRRLEEVAERTHIKPLLLRSTLELSGGQKQRVAIAACLMMRPKVIVLDEPTAELDPAGKEMVLETIHELHRKWGYTIVFVDHNLDVTLPYADRVVVVAEGQIIADVPPSKLYDVPDIGKRLPMPQIVELARRTGVRIAGRDGSSADPLTVMELQAALNDSRKAGSPGRLVSETPIGENSASPIIELKRVMFRYRKHEEELTIKPMDLKISRGEFVAVIGQNGAGKSTLCKLITGLLKPQSGEVLIHNKPSAQYRAQERVRHIGFVFQNPDYQFVARTVYDEIAYGLRVQKLGSQEIDAKVREVSALLQIDAYLQEHPHFLSRGERRRVAIASVLAMEPDVIILDEPTTGLDSVRCRELMKHICNLWQQGHTIIMLTHDMRVVADYIPRTILLSGGQIVWDEATRTVFTRGAEELSRFNISAPPVVELTRLLGWQSPALTSDEFVEAMACIETRGTPAEASGGVS
ncbi:ABC transporter ATP-binding protein [Paenibacillus pinihumi]|uniref:ABC transporter ATP-binding protein n=1 Tax=Paenibacillus pinihumi TaxID=669462 RepID=UPI000424F4E9|nr:ABC transporter ATP-binding protein [Paenibacillus pinihumi]